MAAQNEDPAPKSEYFRRLGPVALLIAPFAALGAYWVWKDVGLLIFASLFSLAAFACGVFLTLRNPNARRHASQTDDVSDAFRMQAADFLAICKSTGQATAAFSVSIDAPQDLIERFGRANFERIFDTLRERCWMVLRSDDALSQVSENQIAIVLRPVHRMDLEFALSLAQRLQTIVEDPVSVDAQVAYVSASVGFCVTSNLNDPSPPTLLEAAQLAAAEAQRAGPSAIRAYSPSTPKAPAIPTNLTEDAIAAFERGEITAWFQPQLSTDTGHVSGLEALARWIHPQRGMIAPGEFLETLERASLMTRLSETMLKCACETLEMLDTAGLDVPCVGVNFSADELNNPRLVDRIRWQLDRCELDPSRLNVEILETVIAGAPDDMIVGNITALSNLGCGIDLDDFGTGHASITSLRRLPIQRLKIDRSFVTKCDTDIDQQRMLTTILTMADRLRLDTVAEGLETLGEHALVSQLGVGHVQGFGIARPMPADMLTSWIATHQSKIAPPPAINGP